MQSLIARIEREGKHLGGGILKVDGFLNHRLDPDLTLEMGREFKRRFKQAGVGAVDKIVTAEVSGIGPALATGAALGVPVIYARKQRPITMPATVFETRAPSPTKGGVVHLIVSPEYLERGDRVVIIDDFLSSGETVAALAELVVTAGAVLQAFGFVIEKAFAQGRLRLKALPVPIVSLAIIERLDDSGITFR